MNPSRIAVLMLGASVTVGVAACGGSGGGGSTAAPSTQAAKPASQQPAAKHKAPSHRVAKDATGLTPPGTQLAFGKPAKVGWVPPSKFSASGPHVAIPLDVSVEAIEKGTLDDFKNIQIEGKQPNSTPYYVKVRVTNLGSTGPASDDPDVTFRAIDDRGQAQPSVTFLGDFQRCDDRSPPKPFSRGKTFESCLTYLVPGGGSIKEVDWNDGPAEAGKVAPYFERPIVWKAG